MSLGHFLSVRNNHSGSLASFNKSAQCLDSPRDMSLTKPIHNVSPEEASSTENSCGMSFMVVSRGVRKRLLGDYLPPREELETQLVRKA
jgi:hypothetical protein